MSSLEHRPGRIDFDDLQSESTYSPRGAYQQSKFANAVFGLELDRRLRAAGLPVISVLAHPGYSATNLQITGPTGAMKAVLRGRQPAASPRAPSRARCRSSTRRPRPASRAASSIGPDGFQQARGAPTVVQPVGRARDEETGAAPLGGLRGAHRRLVPRLMVSGRGLLGRWAGSGCRRRSPSSRAREWDAIVVGGGHNGLTAAAYLARAGKGVLVLERRDQLGGACTLERPFADERFVISPCAYVVGLLDPS